MSRYLTIDIGAGTMDILCYDAQTGEHVKAVAISPVRHIARQIEQTPGQLVVTGVEMGGGPVTDALKQRASETRVIMDAAAAATLHHDLDRVRDWGITLLDDARMDEALDAPGFSPVVLGDVQPERIARIIEGLGLPMAFEAVALCAQDHGVAPKGVSHLDFRHNLYQEMLDRNPEPHSLIFRSDEVPTAFNRLRCMAETADCLNAREVYVMDSGMAALAGGAQDASATGRSPVAILDVATSHTVVAVLEGDTIAGVVEYHTRDVTREKIETLIRQLADGRIRHEQILAEGGHGAYLRKSVGFDSLQAIIATGPKRRIMADSPLPIVWGAPWGDNMMTGTVGLLEALRRRKAMAPIAYI